ncbi:MAG TPA: glucosamine-6-phosphate deaminase [Cellulomonas sp.]
MRILVLPDRDDRGRAAARLVLAALADVPAGRSPVLGVATGSSPLPLYEQLAAQLAGRADPPGWTAFALDEYLGLPEGHPESYRAVVDRDVRVPLRLDPAAVHVPPATAADVPAAAVRYEVTIAAAGGVDVQVLGIGGNGHLAFNEPGSALDSRTRVVRLTEQTRQDNARFFGGSVAAVPTHALTQGVGTVLAARRLVVLAAGAEKASAVARAVEGPVTADLPASALQRHPDVTLVLDPAAAALLGPASLAAGAARQPAGA